MIEYVYPKKVLYSENVENVKCLTERQDLQIGLNERNVAALHKKGYVILDFGKEICGGVRVLTFGTFNRIPVDVRIRFGESLTECCSEIGEKNSGNDHSPRDLTARIGFLSDLCFGETGFRFVRIDNTSDIDITIKSIVAKSAILKKKAIYSYKGQDKEISKIFSTAKRTIDLCSAGEFLWDGIKRDRLVWIGDTHPEMLALTTLYGRMSIIEKSLNFIKSQTPLPNFMNNMPTYSMWWIIILADYYKATGCKDFLDKQLEYLTGLIGVLNDRVGENGELNYDLFVDWPTKFTTDEEVGSRIINIIAVNKAIEILKAYNADLTVANRLKDKLLKGSFDVVDKKQVIALKYFAFNKISDEEYGKLVKNGAEGFSTFMSYYILTAIASRDKQLAVKLMKEYYGAMIDKGATSFWEDFDTAWVEGSCKLNEFPKAGQKDIHGDYGKFCYEGFRHSFCHGWSSGVIKFIKETEE